MHLGTWCMVTHCWYQSTKECSTSQARSINISSHKRSWHTERSNLIKARWVQYMCNHENNVPSRLWPQRPFGILLLWDLSTLCVMDHLWLIILILLAWLVEPSFVYCHQQCVTIYYVPKWCMNYHKAVVVITPEGTLFSWLHIYCAHFAFVRFECVMDHLRLIIDR